MELTPGLRLRSQVDTTEVIVVRPPAQQIELDCGGTPMVPIGTEVAESATPAAGLDTGTALGKRYTTNDPDGTLELLVTKAGTGTLTAAGIALILKEAKPLPSSD